MPRATVRPLTQPQAHAQVPPIARDHSAQLSEIQGQLRDLTQMVTAGFAAVRSEQDAPRARVDRALTALERQGEERSSNLSLDNRDVEKVAFAVHEELARAPFSSTNGAYVVGRVKEGDRQMLRRCQDSKYSRALVKLANTKMSDTICSEEETYSRNIRCLY